VSDLYLSTHLADLLSAHRRCGDCFATGTTTRASAQIQFWKIISRLEVAIDLPTNAAEIGSIAAKPADAMATNAHNSQRGLLPRLNTYTSARLATVADGR
jgi:hypothetical protein